MNSISQTKLNKAMITPGLGKIEGAFFRDLDTTESEWQDDLINTIDPCFLPDGQELLVDAGNSYVIKTDGPVWMKAIFHQAGKMTGPLVYFKANHENPVDTAQKSKKLKVNKYDLEQIRLITSTISLMFLAMMLATLGDDLFPTWIKVVLAAIVFIVARLFIGSLAELRKYQRIAKPDYNDNKEALSILEDQEKKRVVSVPFSAADREIVKQSTLI